MMRTNFLKTLRLTAAVLVLGFGLALSSDSFAQEKSAAPAAAAKTDAPKKDAAAPAAKEEKKAENAPAPDNKDEKKAEVKAEAKKDAKSASACDSCSNKKDANDRVQFCGKYGLFWGLALLGSIAALCFARKFYCTMMKADEGNEEMVAIASAVREGADAYLWQQYKIVGFFFVVICIFLAYLAWGLGVQNKIVPFAFLTGGFFSGLAGWCGMKTATWASSRTAAGAMKSLNQGLQVAFRSGAVMGLTVVGLGLLDIVLWFGALYWVFPQFGWEMDLVEITVVMLCFGMGASSQALFARVGGGIYTKAADVGADLVGKVEAGIPEDDKRNPATIADNVGDNVGDVAGMGADLYESYCGSILSTAALGVAAYSAMGGTIAQQLNALFLPILLAAVGIILSILGIFLVRTEENADQGTLLKALGKGVNLPSVFIAILSIAIAYYMVPDYKWVGLSVVTGLVAGWLIGKWTEYRTSYEYKPTQAIANQGKTGPATVIIAGIAEGMFSTWAPVVIVGIATLLSFGFATNFDFSNVKIFSVGLYGVGIAAVGMLSTLGVTLATDAYGPIADNAGGNAEMSELPSEVRERTDALDSLGNTTAATGKGFAIGSAALTALALLAAYIEEVRVGFERWGDTVVQSLEKVDSNKPGFYKVSNQFVVKYDGKAATESARNAASAKGRQWFPQTYLVMPSQANNPEDGNLIYRGAKTTWKKSNDAWKSLDTKKGAQWISEENAQVIPFIPTKDEDPNRPDMVKVHSANMMDWMNYYSCNLLNPKVLVGIFLGAMSVFVFGAMTMMAVGRAASGMVEEVRRQFRENPGIMDYKVKPDYRKPVAISTKAAQKEMVLPSLLGLIMPVIVGLLLGVTGVIGLLVGTLTCGFCVAVYMANAGGAWDNAKKYIETGQLGGKKSDVHKATVVGDTVGDPFKDTTGPSLNILIKLMSMVSVVAAGLIVKYSLDALGIF
ncbi:MAG: sodium-translocating pyrophosphatase [Planctomycetia bacterium]|nr:sodium-translocating pyrophosphatase [Planctomycetia bacterium]